MRIQLKDMEESKSGKKIFSLTLLFHFFNSSLIYIGIQEYFYKLKKDNYKLQELYIDTIRKNSNNKKESEKEEEEEKNDDEDEDDRKDVEDYDINMEEGEQGDDQEEGAKESTELNLRRYDEIEILKTIIFNQQENNIGKLVILLIFKIFASSIITQK